MIHMLVELTFYSQLTKHSEHWFDQFVVNLSVLLINNCSSVLKTITDISMRTKSYLSHLWNLDFLLYFFICRIQNTGTDKLKALSGFQFKIYITFFFEETCMYYIYSYKADFVFKFQSLGFSNTKIQLHEMNIQNTAKCFRLYKLGSHDFFPCKLFVII